MSGYLAAVAATLTVLLLRLLLSPLIGDSAYFFPFVIAVTVSAWYGGLNPGLLSTVLGAVIAVYFFVPPHYGFTIGDPRIAIGLVFFLASSVIISLVCDALSMLLQLLGNNVSSAYDGEQALETAKELKPDVVLLDIGLPKLNGYEVARQIRLDPWGHNAMLIAIKGWGQTEDKDLSRQAGFDHHVVKPVDPDALLKLIQKRKATHS